MERADARSFMENARSRKVWIVRLTSIASAAARPRVRAAAAARRLPQLTKPSAGAICKRRDAAHLGTQEGLQPRARRTARRPLLAVVRRSDVLLPPTL
jgi:hypothetical protein